MVAVGEDRDFEEESEGVKTPDLLDDSGEMGELIEGEASVGPASEKREQEDSRREPRGDKRPILCCFGDCSEADIVEVCGNSPTNPGGFEASAKAYEERSSILPGAKLYSVLAA